MCLSDTKQLIGRSKPPVAPVRPAGLNLMLQIEVFTSCLPLLMLVSVSVFCLLSMLRLSPIRLLCLNLSA